MMFTGGGDVCSILLLCHFVTMICIVVRLMFCSIMTGQVGLG